MFAKILKMCEMLKKVASSRFFAVDERDDRREEERDDLQPFFRERIYEEIDCT